MHQQWASRERRSGKPGGRPSGLPAAGIQQAATGIAQAVVEVEQCGFIGAIAGDGIDVVQRDQVPQIPGNFSGGGRRPRRLTSERVGRPTVAWASAGATNGQQVESCRWPWATCT